MPKQISSSAEVHPSVTLGVNTRIWHAAQIREYVEIGSNCSVGSMAYVGPNIKIGNNVKIQNSSLIYDPCELGRFYHVGFCLLRLVISVYDASAPNLVLAYEFHD